MWRATLAAIAVLTKPSHHNILEKKYTAVDRLLRRLRNENKKAEKTEKKEKNLEKFINNELDFLRAVSISRREIGFSSSLAVNIYSFKFDINKKSN